MNPAAIEAMTRDHDLSETARGKQAGAAETPSRNEAPGLAGSRGTSPGIATGGAALAGAAAGAAIGTAVGGPAGAVVGGVVGAVTGALGGVAAATAHAPKANETSPVPQERDVTRVGEVHREDLRR